VDDARDVVQGSKQFADIIEPDHTHWHTRPIAHLCPVAFSVARYAERTSLPRQSSYLLLHRFRLSECDPLRLILLRSLRGRLLDRLLRVSAA
jgi:hypothetical protein